MAWSSDSMSGKPVEVFEPQVTGPVRGVVLFLHGYDEVTLRENPTYTSQLDQHMLACVCPLGGHCCWTDRVFPPFDPQCSPIEFLSREIPKYCQTRWGLVPGQIGITGVELGGQGALQLAYRKARLFPIVVAISPKVDFETWYGHGMSLDEIFTDREAARQATATLHIHPLDWPKQQLLLCDPADHYCLDGMLTLASKLSSTGIPFDSDFVSSHGGFGWDYANQMGERAIGYIAQHLEPPVG